jgi:hypothetical protein
VFTAQPASQLADVRRGEWGTTFPSEVVRDFIHSALRHPAAADMVSEYVFDIATGDNEPPADIGEALRVALGEVLSAATADDWKQIGRDVLADARECIGDDPPSAASPEESIPATWWPTPPGRSRRKTHVHVPQEALLAWLTEKGSATTDEIAAHFDISHHTSWRKADGLVAQGKLDVVPGERGRYGQPRIYSVPRPPDAPAENPAGERPAAGVEGPQDRLALPTGSS